MSKQYDNITTIDQRIVNLMRHLIDAAFSLDNELDVDDIEWQSRDGYIAYNHNRGGFSKFSYERIDHLVGSGQTLSKKTLNKVNEWYNETYEQVKKDNAHLTEGTDEFYNILDDNFCYDYDCLGYKVQIVYNGNNEINVVAGYTYDSPYYRSFDDITFDKIIKFKNYSDAKAKLQRVAKKLGKAY